MQVEKLGLLSKLEKSGLTLSKVGVGEIFRCDGPTVLTLGLGKPPVRKNTLICLKSMQQLKSRGDCGHKR